jgi:hypothetical protein
VQFICVLNMTSVQKTYTISIRMLNVETAQVAGMGTTESRLSSTDEIKEAANNLVAQMTGTAQEAKKGDTDVTITGPGDIFSSGNLTVFIDGQRVGSLRGDGTLNFSVQKGSRVMSVKWQGDGTASELKKPYKFNAQKGKRLMFKINMKMVGQEISVVPVK